MFYLHFSVSLHLITLGATTLSYLIFLSIHMRGLHNHAKNENKKSKYLVFIQTIAEFGDMFYVATGLKKIGWTTCELKCHLLFFTD